MTVTLLIIIINAVAHAIAGKSFCVRRWTFARPRSRKLMISLYAHIRTSGLESVRGESQQRTRTMTII